MAQRIAQPVHLGLAWLLVAGLLVQVFLAGLGVFAGPANFATHRDFGYLLEALPFFMAVTALPARLGRQQVVAAAVMFGQFILQSVFIALRADLPAVAALHPVNGVLILLVAIWAARDASRRRRDRSLAAPEAAQA